MIRLGWGDLDRELAVDQVKQNGQSQIKIDEDRLDEIFGRSRSWVERGKL